jgi:hypothetical protein
VEVCADGGVNAARAWSVTAASVGVALVGWDVGAAPLSLELCDLGGVEASAAAGVPVASESPVAGDDAGACAAWVSSGVAPAGSAAAGVAQNSAATCGVAAGLGEVAGWDAAAPVKSSAPELGTWSTLANS